MEAIILSAGIGSRLHPYTIDIPKCLVKVGEHPMIEWELKALSNFEFQTIYIVVGHKKEIVKDFVIKHFPNLNIRFVENQEYKTTSNLQSLKLAMLHISGEVMIINGDLIFNKEVITSLLNNGYDNAVAVINKGCDEEDMKVRVAQDDDKKIIEISKGISLDECDGHAVGIYKIKDVDILKDAMKKTKDCNYFNEAVNKMTYVVPVTLTDISNHFAIEIDFPEDLKEANRIFKWRT